MTLHGPSAEVRQELRLRFPRNAPDQITLRTPAVLGDSLQLLDGGQFLDDPAAAPATRTVRLAGQRAGAVLQLRYSFPTTEKTHSPCPWRRPSRPRTAKRASASGATPANCRCRRTAPTAAGPSRTLRKSRASIACRCSCCGGCGRTRRCRCGWTMSRARPPRSWSIACSTGPSRADGVWEIRASYLLRQIAEPTLDVELPAAPRRPGAARGPRRPTGGMAGGGGVGAGRAGQAPGPPAPGRRPGPPAGRAGRGLPVEAGPDRGRGGPRNAAAAVAGRRPPAGADALGGDAAAGRRGAGPEDGAAARRTIALRGWLLAPQLAVTGADLERWFAGPDVPARTEGARRRAGPGLLAGGRRTAGAHLRPAVGLAARLLAAAAAPGRLPVHPGPPVLRRPAARGRLVLAHGRAAGSGGWRPSGCAGRRSCTPSLMGANRAPPCCCWRWRSSGCCWSATAGRSSSCPASAGRGRVPRWCGPTALTGRPGEPSTVDAPRPAGSSQQPA